MPNTTKPETAMASSGALVWGTVLRTLLHGTAARDAVGARQEARRFSAWGIRLEALLPPEVAFPHGVF